MGINRSYHPAQQPIYYSIPQKSNFGLVIAGLAIVGAGGYLYYAYQKGLWPFGEQGFLDPEPPTGCTGAPCNYNGSHRCKSGDLCECVNNQWTLYEQNSSLCGTGATTHKECFNSQTGLITCAEEAGPGTDTCYGLGYSYGCSCDVAEGVCDTGSWCNPSDDICLMKANNTFVYGTQTGTSKDLYVYPTTPFASNKMNYCRIDFQGGGLWETINWSFWALYSGAETMICDGFFFAGTPSGYFWIPQDYPHENMYGFVAQGFEGFKIKFSNTNAYPKAFQGTFTFA